MKENVLCMRKSLLFKKNNIICLVSNAELNNGTVRMVSLLDPVQTVLPVLKNDLMHGPYGTKCPHGYLRDSFKIKIVKFETLALIC